MKKDISFIVKVTNDCNLRCSYCYHFKNNHNLRNLYMDKDTLRDTVKFLINNNTYNAHFIWHGGEPLYQGYDFFQNIVEMQKEFCKDNMVISNAIQTNATMLDEKWIKFFVDNDFHIGVSLDGYKELHIKNRSVTESVYDLIIDKIKLLNSHNANYGVLTVVNDNTIGNEEELLSFFIDNNINNVGFLPATVFEYNKLDECKTISPFEYGNFLIRFFDAWISSGVTGMSFREYDEYFRGKLDVTHRLCVNSNDCDRYYTVAPDGNIFMCDCFPMNDEYCLGNVKHSKYVDQLKNSMVEKIYNNMQKLPDECDDCVYKKICFGGCKYHRWIVSDDLGKPQYFCQANKMLYEHIDKIIDNKGKR